MCGGGGGGDGGASAREAERQKKQNAAIDRVNRLFGIYDDGFNQGKPDKADFSSYNSDYGSQFDEQGYNTALAAWEKQRADAKTTAEKNKTAREDIYSNLRDNTFSYYMNDLMKQRGDAERGAKFSLSRRGLRGGSVQNDTYADIGERADRATLDIGNRADAAATKLRASDEQARLDLISRIQAGMSGDAAIQSATQQMQNAAKDIGFNAQSNALGQVFKDYGTYITEDARARGRARGYNYGANFRSNPGSYYGTTREGP